MMPIEMDPLFLTFAILMPTLSTALAFFLFNKRRFIILKPTFFIGALSVIQSWSAAANAEYIYSFLDSPWDYLFLMQITPALLLIISTFSMDRDAQRAWVRATNVPEYRYLGLRQTVVFALGLSVICLAVYFAYVPPWRTGLWIAIASGDPLMSRDARESSLKLLPAFPRYLFSFHREVLSRYLVAALALIGVAYWLNNDTRKLFLILVFVICLALSASIYGARGPGGLVIATFFLVIYLYKRAPFKITYVVGGIAAILLIPTLISSIRGGGGININSLWSAFAEGIIPRILDVNAVVGVWHMDYVQQYGFWGIQGIAKLALVFGVEPVNVDNLIMNVYFKSTESGLATVGSYITNYTRYGLFFGMAFSVASVWACDLVLLFYRRINATILLPAICTLLMVFRGAIGSNFETLFITRGLLPSILLLWLLNRIVEKYERRRDKLSQPLSYTR